MSFSEQEQKLIQIGIQSNKSPQEISRAVSLFRAGIKPVSTRTTQETSTFLGFKQGEESIPAKFVSGAIPEIKRGFREAGQEVVGDIQTAGQKISEAPTLGKKFEQAMRGGLRTVGNVIKTAFGVPIEAAVGGLSELDQIQSLANDPKVGKALDTVNQGLSKAIAPALAKWEQFSQQNPEMAGDLADIGEILATLVGEKPIQQALSRSSELTRTGLETVEQTVRTGTEAVGRGIRQTAETGKTAIEPVTKFVGGVGEEVSRIPARIGTNVEARQALMKEISSLPTQTAQNAVRDGISIGDVKTVLEIKPTQKSQIKKLIDTAEQFSQGKTKTNPIEIVGQPITQRLKTLQTESTKIGQKLGDVANTLGDVTRSELVNPILSRLQRVQGLSGLKLSEKGILDFSDTVLASSLSKADRQSIQKIFVEAIKDGTGKSKHLLRQELFEILGGRKGSLQAITATEEKAYQAVRQGLSDILESKNTQYKILSNEYRTVVQPLSEMRKLMRNVIGADEDILDMASGLLARRLTSNAASNPQIRNILRSLDNAITSKGVTTESVEQLQDVYNILNKYYDIAGETTFQGLITTGVDRARGITDVAVDAVRGAAGETAAVRQKALRKLFDEVL